ncbi:uncharacterized protein KZ484_021877 [Pholidichthys leucotaenia]
MSSVEPPSEFRKETQTAAAEETFSGFEETSEERKFHRTGVSEDLQHVEQRWLLDSLLGQNARENVDSADRDKQENPDTPQIKEEEEEAELLQIKEEEEEQYIVQKADDLFLKQESDGFMVTLPDDESHKSEPNNDGLHSHDSGTIRTIQSQSKEIFGDSEHVTVWYKEDGNDCQHRLLDIDMKPEPDWHRTKFQYHYVCQEEEESLTVQQLWNQERNSSLDQEEPHSPQIKEEEDEGDSSWKTENLQLIRETGTLVRMDTDKDHDYSEPETVDHSLLSHSTPLSESSDQGGRKIVNSESTTNHTVVRPFVYKICGEKYDEQRYLFAHFKNHMVEKCFHCDTCEKKSEHLSYLKIHMRTHTGEKPFCCEICGKRFSYNHHLSLHRRTHTGEKPFCCETCGNRFRYSHHLSLHRRTHTGEKPFCCKTCGRSFSQRGNLSRHMRTHTDEKPFSCETCGKSFRCDGHLSRHVGTHTSEKPFSCETCGKSFRCNNHLSRHMRTHTGEKPFSCETCGKSFSRSSHLSHHSRIHRDEKQFSCEMFQ